MDGINDVSVEELARLEPERKERNKETSGSDFRLSLARFPTSRALAACTEQCQAESSSADEKFWKG